MMSLNYPYKPSPLGMARACLFFGVCALVMAHAAMTNDRGLILDGIVNFSIHGATIFYWCVAAVSCLFVVVGIPAFFIGIFSSHRLVLTGTSVSAPRSGFSRSPTVVELSSITGVDIKVMQRQRMLNIHHKSGKLTIMQSWLPNEAAFNEVAGALSAVVARGR
jgi:hypothetical protein